MACKGKLTAREREIRIGTRVEMEHTSDRRLARKIALDHVREFPDYYTNKKYGLLAREKGLRRPK